MNDKPADPAKLSFEDALRELEGIVDTLDRGEASLDQSIALYERGAKLKARCEAELARAEEKVAQIVQGEDGRPTGTAPLGGS